MAEYTDYLTGKIGCTVRSPYRHVDVAGEIIDESMYNFLVRGDGKMCLCNKVGIWVSQKSCKKAKIKKGDRKSLYKLVPVGKEAVVYTINARVSGTLRHVDSFLVVVETGEEEYVIHKDLILAICW